MPYAHTAQVHSGMRARVCTHSSMRARTPTNTCTPKRMGADALRPTGNKFGTKAATVNVAESNVSRCCFPIQHRT
eukprot:2628430-Pleurochrysis_carterae.AAC.2